MIKPFSSLFTRIVCWFFLNLLIVGGILYAFFALQSEIDVAAQFGEQAADRMRSAARLISHDLQTSAVEEWNDVLLRHSQVQGVDFVLIMPDEQQWASHPIQVPDLVMKRAKKTIRPRKFGGGRGHGRQMGRMPMMRRMMHPDYETIFPIQKEMEPGRPLKEDRLRRAVRFRMRTDDPTRYWVATEFFLPHAMQGPPLMGVLFAVSESVTGNGFFFDPFPWIIVAAVVGICSVLWWIPLVRSITRPLARMTRAAEYIADGRFDVTIQEKRKDEIGRLAAAINHMTSRLLGFVRGQKRFLGDVAHELGSPIARIQFGLGILEQRVGPENQKRVKDVIADVHHMSGLVNELLSFSRASIAEKKASLEHLTLLPLVERVIQRENPAAQEIRIQVDPLISAWGNPELLSRALSNIIRNAVKYAGRKGPITILTDKTREKVFLTVQDNGPGVPPEFLDQLFEPFFRPDASRNRESGGVGLGLAIVKTCIEACEGTVSAKNLSPNGFAITIALQPATKK